MVIIHRGRHSVIYDLGDLVVKVMTQAGRPIEGAVEIQNFMASCGLAPEIYHSMRINDKAYHFMEKLSDDYFPLRLVIDMHVRGLDYALLADNLQRAIMTLRHARIDHNDLHRENILVNVKDFSVKIIDFEKAKVVEKMSEKKIQQITSAIKQSLDMVE